MVTREEVVHAYRFFFGRDPESERVIERWLPVEDWLSLRDVFLESSEFHAKFAARLETLISPDDVLAEPNHVEIDISDGQYRTLIEHVQGAWEALGAEKPHWSVLTDPRFLPDKIEANLGGFYESGAQSWELVERAAARAGTYPLREGTAFELGCGVGRVTAQLAKRFRRVLAADVSRLHLDIAQAYLESAGIKNVTLSRLERLECLMTMEAFDFFYSVIVLQHNPPPLIRRMLEIIFGRLRRGGVAYFQVPVASTRYQFSIEQYLRQIAAGDPVMEMHVFPQKDLFRVMHEGGLRILDLQRDNMTGPGFQSITIFAEKTG